MRASRRPRAAAPPVAVRRPSTLCGTCGSRGVAGGASQGRVWGVLAAGTHTAHTNRLQRAQRRKQSCLKCVLQVSCVFEVRSAFSQSWPGDTSHLPVSNSPYRNNSLCFGSGDCKALAPQPHATKACTRPWRICGCLLAAIGARLGLGNAVQAPFGVFAKVPLRPGALRNAGAACGYGPGSGAPRHAFAAAPRASGVPPQPRKHGFGGVLARPGSGGGVSRGLTLV